LKSPVPEQATPLAAILLMLVAGALFSALDASAKYLVHTGIRPEFVSWMRFLVHVVLVLFIFRAWSNRAVFRTRSPTLQIVRGFGLFGSTFFNFAALQTLQLAEGIAIAFLSPMLITALAGPVLGEWAGWRRWLAVLAGLAGVLVITRPGLGSFEVGHLLAIASTVSYAVYVLLTRKLAATETSESLILYPALTPVLFMAPAMPAAASMPAEPWLWGLLLFLGVLGGLGHYLIIRAHKMASATALAPYPYMQALWSTLAGYLVFGDLPDRWTVAGATIIIASGLYIVQREQRLRLAARSTPSASEDELAKKL
jgi:drug/metabolite transporter (DMT)-like permease